MKPISAHRLLERLVQIAASPLCDQRIRAVSNESNPGSDVTRYWFNTHRKNADGDILSPSPLDDVFDGFHHLAVVDLAGNTQRL